MKKPLFDDQDLTALDRCFNDAWAIVAPRLCGDNGDHEWHRDRLAKIVLDHLGAGHVPDEVCAKAAAEKFLASQL